MKKFIAMLLIFALMPFTVFAEGKSEAELCKETAVKVNNYWISGHKSPPGYSWDNAVYYTGCMEAYYLTGIEAYREYAKKWAEKNAWSGNRNQNRDEWNNSNVYHADNQTAFQVYIDLYNQEGGEEKIARALEVTEAQMKEPTDKFWTWCDALYMAMPVYSKLYLQTGDERYLDAMYRFFKFAKETMYDGEGGINYSGEPVNLFFRDPGYIKSRVEGEKNIWSRGTGWVMAAFARVFSDIPEDWEHYDYFMKTYKEMAQSCLKFVKEDTEGRKYYTQSIIPFYPISNENPFGYETSGTALTAYSILWGINSGVLPKEEYGALAEGFVKYIREVAVQPDGRVGYTQPIGAAAGKAVNARSTYNFGTGAVLLALSEAVRYYGGQQGDLYPYLKKKCVSTLTVKIGSKFAFDGKKIVTLEEAPFIEDGMTYVPKSALSLFDSRLDAPEKVLNGVKYVKLRDAAKGKLFWSDAHRTVTISVKEKPFYGCDEALLKMLDDMLTTGTLPERAPQEEIEFRIVIPEIDNADRIKFESVYSADIPEPENGPGNAVDLDIETRWAALGDPSIVFDIGKTEYVEKIALAFWKNDTRTTAYELWVSENGTDYKMIADNSSTKGETFDYVSVKDNIRYIKLIGHGNSAGNGWTSLLELAALRK